MNNVLIYTFRTFPWINELKNISENVIVLDKLKEDINKVEQQLNTKKYNFILGIAKGGKKSVFESKGMNKFNKKIISKSGEDSYLLNYPINGYKDIGINKSYTTSFCNWGIYRVGKLLSDNRIETKHSFVHILEKDMSNLKLYLSAK